MVVTSSSDRDIESIPYLANCRLEKGLWILRDILGGAGQRDLAIV